MTDQPNRSRGSRLFVVAFAVFVFYPLSIGPVWYVLRWLSTWQYISRDFAMACGFFPYLPLFVVCDRIPGLWIIHSTYLGLFGLKPTDFVPG